jgi:UDP-N-acetylmuramoylalanine--D-glutamate ligase
MQSFPGLAHRQQWILTANGVSFINDSKATNADAAAKALACYDNIFWIVGGRPKEGGLEGLDKFLPRIRHALVIGEAAVAFKAWFAGRVPVTHCGNLATAVAVGYAEARKSGLPKTTLLLSPACASWDQFEDFEDRGRQFIKFSLAFTGANIAPRQAQQGAAE